jgi:hypothetical protein
MFRFPGFINYVWSLQAEAIRKILGMDSDKKKEERKQKEREEKVQCIICSCSVCAHWCSINTSSSTFWANHFLNTGASYQSTKHRGKLSPLGHGAHRNCYFISTCSRPPQHLRLQATQVILTSCTCLFPKIVLKPWLYGTSSTPLFVATSSYPPPREKCAGPSCTNDYKYRHSKLNLPLCSLKCYKAVQGNAW